MAAALVYTGEHYVSDCLLGWIYAVIAFVAVSAVFDRWFARAPAATAEPVLAD